MRPILENRGLIDSKEKTDDDLMLALQQFGTAEQILTLETKIRDMEKIVLAQDKILEKLEGGGEK